MPDPNATIPPIPEKWSALFQVLLQWIFGIGAGLATLASGISFARSKASKDKGGVPVALEEAFDQFRREMRKEREEFREEFRNEMADAKRIATDARDDARMLRNREIAVMGRRMEDIETSQFVGQQKADVFFEKAERLFNLIKQRFSQDAPRPADRLPE